MSGPVGGEVRCLAGRWAGLKTLQLRGASSGERWGARLEGLGYEKGLGYAEVSLGGFGGWFAPGGAGWVEG